ncbi:MAG: glycosyltransferase family 9 protein [Elusimicrobiaceae bacterium]
MTNPGRILVIQLRRIGDNILTLPALAALKKTFPGAKIDFLAEPPADQLLNGNPSIDELLVYDPRRHFFWIRKIRARGYDWVIDFLGTPRSIAIAAASGAEIRAGAKDVFWSFLYNVEMKRYAEPRYAPSEKIKMLEPLGVKLNPREILPVLIPDPRAVAKAKEFLRGKGGPVLGVAPASRKITRQYPAEHFAQALKMINAATGAKAVILWGPGELATAQRIIKLTPGISFLSPETKSLSDLAGLISCFDLLIANCNGPKHIAVATGVSTITVHASSDPRNWTPPSPATGEPATTLSQYFGNTQAKRPVHLYVISSMPCAPCRKNECADLRCLTEMPPGAIADRAIEILRIGQPTQLPSEADV